METEGNENVPHGSFRLVPLNGYSDAQYPSPSWRLGSGMGKNVWFSSGKTTLPVLGSNWETGRSFTAPWNSDPFQQIENRHKIT